MFKHKDIKIEMAPSTGEFTATVNGMFVRKPSLAAMKKYIDDASKVKFEPFTAIADCHRDDKSIKESRDYCRVRVVGVGKSQGRYSLRENCFLVIRPKKGDNRQEHQEEERGTLYEDTPESIALLLEGDKAMEAKRVAESKHATEIQRIRKMQKKVSPDSYAKTKKGE